MPVNRLLVLEASNITVAGGTGSLSGITQGDASHLLGETIRIDTIDPIELRVRDNSNDEFFDDNDGNQTLAGRQTIDGTSYANNTVVEAEYTIVLEDPNTGITYTAVGFNVRDSSPSYATVEGLSFVGGLEGYPPAGVDLVVVEAGEGPGDFGQPAITYDEFEFPICFAGGTQIAVPGGTCEVSRLRIGDLVLTQDNGPQPVLWKGFSEVDPRQIAEAPQFRPVRIASRALGGGLPEADLVVSQQHRILLTGWKAELLFGVREVLVAAKHLVGRPGIEMDFAPGGLTYHHVMFERHEIVFANGAPTESFRPGPAGLEVMSEAARVDLARVLGDRDVVEHPAARRMLKAWEASALAG